MLVCVLLAVPLAACGARGFSIEDAVPDRSIVTGSVSAAPAPTAADAAARSDEATIRNAVSSAIVGEVGGDGVGWENAETGSRGAISGIEESRETGLICRRFTASRESFDGVALYRGKTCLGPGRSWVMNSFDKVE